MRLGTYYRYLVVQNLNLPLSAERVLDVGCHDGFLLSRLEAQLKVGIDITPARIFPDIEYIEDDFLKHDFGNRKFDRILALDVLEHIEGDRNYVEKMLGLMSSKGLAILSTPSNSIKIFPPFLQSWVDRRWGHIHRRGYSTLELMQLVNEGERSRIKIIHWNCPFFRLIYLPLSLLWRISSSMAKKVLNPIVKLDARFRIGNYGFFYVMIS